LKSLKISFNEIDVTTNQTLQKGVSDYSGSSTYPQLFVQGKFIGDLATVKSLHQKGQFISLIPALNIKQDLDGRLRSLLSQQKVMIFMKGSPTEPRCGFSKKAVELLNKVRVEFGSFDILSDAEVREGLKKFSNWPTYPQLYVNGELIGGVDIMAELDENGELSATVSA